MNLTYFFVTEQSAKVIPVFSDYSSVCQPVPDTGFRHYRDRKFFCGLGTKSNQFC